MRMQSHEYLTTNQDGTPLLAALPLWDQAWHLHQLTGQLAYAVPLAEAEDSPVNMMFQAVGGHLSSLMDQLLAIMETLEEGKSEQEREARR